MTKKKCNCSHKEGKRWRTSSTHETSCPAHKEFVQKQKQQIQDRKKYLLNMIYINF